MKSIILSIAPQHVDNIFTGKKKFEFRKTVVKANKIIFYSTSPVKKVVGEAEIESLIAGTLLDVWCFTKKDAGISYDCYRKYYRGHEKAYAYKLKNIVKYNMPKNLSDIGVSKAPRSFSYLRDPKNEKI